MPECISARLDFADSSEKFLLNQTGTGCENPLYCMFTCQKAKPSRKPKEPLKLFECGATQPGEAVGMDVGTCLRQMESTGIFTRGGPLLTPNRNYSFGGPDSHAFFGVWVYRGHGVPLVFVTDQGKDVDGAANHELYRLNGGIYE